MCGSWRGVGGSWGTSEGLGYENDWLRAVVSESLWVLGRVDGGTARLQPGGRWQTKVSQMGARLKGKVVPLLGKLAEFQ